MYILRIFVQFIFHLLVHLLHCHCIIL